MKDLIRLDNLELIYAFIGLIVFLIVILIISRRVSRRKTDSNYEDLIEGTLKKREKFNQEHPDWGKTKSELQVNDKIEGHNNDTQESAISSGTNSQSDLPNNKGNDGASTENAIIWDIKREQQLASSSTDILPQATLSKYKFMQAAVNGKFLKLLTSDEKCYFRTWGKYEFYGNIKKALANINAIFDEACEIEGKQNGATKITNVKPGIIDTNLKITKKAIIRLS